LSSNTPNGEAAGNPGPHRFSFLLPLLCVVLLPVDSSAGSVLSVLKPGSFPCGDGAVGLGPTLQASGSCLLTFEPSCFTSGQGTASDPVSDASLLAMLAPVNTRSLLSHCTDAYAEHKNHQYQSAYDSLHFSSWGWVETLPR